MYCLSLIETSARSLITSLIYLLYIYLDRLLSDEQGPKRRVHVPLLSPCGVFRRTSGSGHGRPGRVYELDLCVHRSHRGSVSVSPSHRRSHSMYCQTAPHHQGILLMSTMALMS